MTDRAISSATQTVAQSERISAARSGCRATACSTSGSSPARFAAASSSRIAASSGRRRCGRGARSCWDADGWAERSGGCHGEPAPPVPIAEGTSASIARSRRSARRCRIPAAASLRPRARAASPLESCSKCRSRTISRSSSSGGTRASWKRHSSSWRSASAAGVGDGSRNWAARSSDERSSAKPAAADGQRPLAIHRSFAGLAVPAVGVDDPVGRDLPQPEMERQRRVAEVVGQPLVGLEQHVLHDVAGVDPAREAPGPAAGRSSDGAPAGAAPRARRPRRHPRRAIRCNRASVSLAAGHIDGSRSARAGSSSARSFRGLGAFDGPTRRSGSPARASTISQADRPCNQERWTRR